MNCDEFRERWVDSRHGSGTDAELMQHAQKCQTCAKAVAEEEWLSDSLHQLREEACFVSGSLETEQRLLAEFRSLRKRQEPQFRHWETRHRGVVGAPYRAASVSERARYVQVRSLAVAALNAVAPAMAAIAQLPLSESQRQEIQDFFRRERVAWATAAAAAILSLGMILILFHDRGSGSHFNKATGTKEKAYQSSAGAIPVQENSVSRNLSEGTGNKRPALPARRKAPASLKTGQSGNIAGNSAENALPKVRRPVERVTRFFPTMLAADDQPGVNLQLVRVTVPGKSLDAMGFSVDPRQSEKSIKADILIGADGLTRAIRFVEGQE